MTKTNSKLKTLKANKQTTTGQATSSKKRALNVLATADVEAVRTEMFQGREHLVVPVVALVEGVIHPSNAPKPELALAEEFAKYPQGWNYRPCVLNHPERNGINVSAGAPDIIEDEAFGILFNTELDGKKLKTEAWLDLERIEELGDEYQEIVDRINDGEVVEVSTGLFMSLIERQGAFNGTTYFGVWTDVVPDHLAFLPKGTRGACSAEMGCGAPRSNVQAEVVTSCGRRTWNGTRVLSCTTNGCPCDGQCKVEHDADQARAAQQAASNAIDEGVEKEEDEDLTGATPYKRRRTRNRDNITSPTARRLGVATEFRNNLTDRDRREAINAAMAEIHDGYFEILAVEEKSFVYAEGFSGKLLQRSYSITPQGTIRIGSDAVAVRPVTEFVPVKVKEATMTKKEKVDALIANKATKFTDNDRGFLEGLEEDKLDLLSPAEEPKTEPAVNTTTPNDGKKGADQAASSIQQGTDGGDNAASKKEKPAANVTAPPAQTLEEYIAAAPTPMQEVLQDSLNMLESRRNTLITGLKANKACEFTEEELKVMSVNQLERLSKLAHIPDYQGAGGGNSQRFNADDHFAPEPPALGSFGKGNGAQAA